MLVKAQMFYLEQKLGRLWNRGLRSFFNSERGRELEFNSVLPTEKSVLLFPGVFQAVLGFNSIFNVKSTKYLSSKGSFLLKFHTVYALNIFLYRNVKITIVCIGARSTISAKHRRWTHKV